MTRMNRAVRDAWCAALRSGDYPQGTGALTRLRPDGGRAYCCLGVLCDLAVAELGSDVVPVDARDLGYSGIVTLRYAGFGGALPPVVRDWAGLDRCDPLVVEPGPVLVSLSVVNDRGASFARIADLIEGSL